MPDSRFSWSRFGAELPELEFIWLVRFRRYLRSACDRRHRGKSERTIGRNRTAVEYILKIDAEEQSVASMIFRPVMRMC